MCFQPWYPALSHPIPVPALLLAQLEGEAPPCPHLRLRTRPSQDRFEDAGEPRAGCGLCPGHLAADPAPGAGGRELGMQWDTGSGDALGCSARVTARRPRVPAPAANGAICCHAPSWLSPAGAEERDFLLKVAVPAVPRAQQIRRGWVRTQPALGSGTGELPHSELPSAPPSLPGHGASLTATSVTLWCIPALFSME